MKKLSLFVCWLFALSACFSPLRAAECVPQIGPLMQVRAVDISPDGKLLALSGRDGWQDVAGEVKIYDLASGELRRTLPLQRGYVSLLQFVDGSKTLITGTCTDFNYQASADSVVRFWDVSSGQLLRAISPPYRAARVTASPDGKWVAWSEQVSMHMNTKAPTAARFVMVGFTPEDVQWGGEPPFMTLQNLVTGAKRTIRRETKTHGRFGFSDDSRLLIFEDNRGFILWNAETGQLSRPAKPDLTGTKNETVEPRGFSGDAKQWLGNTGKRIGIWETATGKRRAWLTTPPGYDCFAVCFLSADEVAIFINNPEPKVPRKDAVPLPPNEKPKTAPVTPPIPVPQDERWLIYSLIGQRKTHEITVKIPYKLGFGYLKNQTMARSYEIPTAKNQRDSIQRYGMQLTALNSGKSHELVSTNINECQKVGFSANGTQLVTLWQDRKCRLWDLRSGQLQSTHEIPRYVAEAPPVLPSAPWRIRTSDGTSFLNAFVKDDIRDFKTAVFSKDEKLVATDSLKGVSISELPSQKLVRNIPLPKNWRGILTFSPDGKFLIGGEEETGGKQEGGVCLLSVANGAVWGHLTAPSCQVDDACFSPDSKRIVTIEHEGRVMLWDVATRSLLQKYPYRGAVTGASFSPSGNALAIATRRDIQIYSLAEPPQTTNAPQASSKPFTSKLLRTIASPGSIINSVAWAPDGTKLAAACSDGAIYQFDAATGTSGVQFRLFSRVPTQQAPPEWATISAEGFFLGSPGAAPFLRWRDGEQWLSDAAPFQNPARVQQALMP